MNAGLCHSDVSVLDGTIPFPTPEDTAYYYGVARNVVEGRGLVSDAIWSFQTPPLVFPRPAFEVWLPLPTLLALIPMAILGTDFHAAQVTTVLLGSLVPVLAWPDRGRPRRRLRAPGRSGRTLAISSGLTAAVSLPLLLHGVLPVRRPVHGLRPRGLHVMVGSSAGAAPGPSTHGSSNLAWAGGDLPQRGRLARPDTDRRLVGLAPDVGIGAPRSSGSSGSRRSSASRPQPVARPDWIVFGSPLPGGATTNALSITGFDIFAYADPPTLSRYLAQGPAFMISSRVDGFIHNLFSVLLVPSFPVGVVGLVSLVVVRGLGTARALRPLVLEAHLDDLARRILLDQLPRRAAGLVPLTRPAQSVLFIVGCLAVEPLSSGQEAARLDEASRSSARRSRSPRRSCSASPSRLRRAVEVQGGTPRSGGARRDRREPRRMAPGHRRLPIWYAGDARSSLALPASRRT